MSTPPTDSSSPPNAIPNVAPAPEVTPPLKRSEDPLLDLILILTILITGVLFVEEIRPDLLNRWLNTSSASDIERLSEAIIQQESNGNPQSINPDSGALGFAQIMPENLPHWSRDALGYEITPQQFLARPDLQEQIIEHRLNLYWQEALRETQGNKETAILRVASRWYSGDPDLYQSTRRQFYNGQEYPSIAEYSQDILRKWRSAP